MLWAAIGTIHAYGCRYSDIFGDGVEVGDGTSVFSGCVFENCTGYGIVSRHEGTAVISDCVFRGNHAGGINLARTVSVSDCEFIGNGNSGALGGAL